MIPWAWMAVEYLQTGEFNIMSGKQKKNDWSIKVFENIIRPHIITFLIWVITLP
jgi:hypothetical protein